MQHGHACKYDRLLLHAHIDLVLVHDCKLAMDERVLYRCNLRFLGSNHLNSFLGDLDICCASIVGYIWIGLSYTVVTDLTALHNDKHSVHLVL